MNTRSPPQRPNSDELLELAQEAGRVGIFEWNVQEGDVYLSPRILSLYGLKDFDGRYETWLNCIYREDRVRITDLIESALAGRHREWQTEFRIATSGDGELKWIEARNIVSYDAQGRALRVVGVTVDVTDRKRSLAQLYAFTETLENAVRERTRELEAENEARRKAEELLRQAQKMEAVGQLTGGIAHDFNNLLTVVVGGLDTIGRLLPSLGNSATVTRIARAKDMATQGAQRAVLLTNRLLAFSRQQPLDPQPLDANKLVATLCEFLRRSLGEAVALETVMAGGLWRAHADANQLENALLNLALNARDAMPTGGKLTIETANSYLDDAYVTSLPEPVEPGQYVLVAVADTGIGMGKSAVDRAFEPFFTTKEAGRGTGLGLSQVYGFVRQSSGHVKIYSEPGLGTTIKIYLPRYRGADEHTENEKQPSGVARAIGTETILVVEDDHELQSYTVEILTELGYHVLAAATGADALQILDRERPIDLLFTDIVMPGGMNGRELADEATRRQAGLKVLFTTGYTRNAIVHHGRLDPGVHLIGKPFSFEELGARVRACLDLAS
jgi:PAS domain S-box-containing protein